MTPNLDLYFRAEQMTRQRLDAQAGRGWQAAQAAGGRRPLIAGCQPRSALRLGIGRVWLLFQRLRVGATTRRQGGRAQPVSGQAA